MSNSPSDDLPLVYSCSGCSSAAQMANALAIRLDRAGHAEMSCIAGVGGDVKPLVRTARSEREIIALDGCRLHCVQACLARHDVTPTHHVMLAEYGVRKTLRADFDPAEADAVYARLESELFPASDRTAAG
ncbi:putative zinc-binding protein [Shimia sp.]|uniref:putative zinc-binding protein n=1 Tax=Shimia sp. TaxID=1954381 RepID=UPI00356143A8